MTHYLFCIILYIMYNMNHDGADRLTPEMCRAGRALLGISQAQLARAAGVSRLTVAHFERAASKPIRVSLAAIRSALESSGIALLPGGAVLREPTASAVPGPSQKVSKVLQILRTAAPHLRELGVKHLSFFGSTARGTQRPDSDIDLLLDLDQQRKLDLLDYAGIIAEIQKLVPQRVDAALRSTLKSHVARNAVRDEIHVF
jgi:predicted nucleotidyltransferase/DNA-binding XRE family transcriptional regulator